MQIIFFKNATFFVDVCYNIIEFIKYGENNESYNI